MTIVERHTDIVAVTGPLHVAAISHMDGIHVDAVYDAAQTTLLSDSA